MPEEIYMFIENGRITEVKTEAKNIKVIIINLDIRKKGEEPIIEFYETELKKREFSLN
ncbi:MAG: hypothetical protein BroJett005_11680 [Ignavibacteriota bacterium]|nr:MAG: hypothetical protein BroJett005_11680 [Ignavibacteriota bacterium]